MLIFEPEMTIKDAKFISSHASLVKLPPQNMPEFAFIGRSNVGKSSLINMLCGRKDLAKTSQTPGKTQTINHFLINELWYLVDLPGYGYAKTSKKLK
ncbi:MAG TPA: ribosome biogenesis GTP-binding protein YihA/YsxC, partial [Flavobacteriales bacterium]|nr:ribosome biogenesis GTP-binding protein YihA/YsxC [Flavobacteriales bacterium]